MEKINLIKQKAKDIRISIIEMLFKAKSGHPGGPLGMADIYATLYFSEMKHDPKNPFWELRDRLVLSNGHTCPVLYSAMAHAGYFDLEKLFTLRQFGSILQGHPHREFLPSLETSSGPLGSGLSQAVGMAISDKREFKETSPRTIYCLISDGEQDEGQIWEAALLAPREKLDNLIVIVDRNYIQIDGNTEDIMPLDPMDKKWEAFNWHVQTIDGHNVEEIISAIALAKNVKLKPSIIIAKTIPGKGVSFMENDYKWHGKAPNVEEASRALDELKAIVV
ncbi:transketolase [Candidatus Parcubacteria bacterium]|nr:transketolase [Candidatus Parcubacteria bacterium]